MFSSALLFFTGTLIQTRLAGQKEIFDAEQSEKRRMHELELQQADHEHQLEMEARKLKSVWAKLYESVISLFQDEVKLAVINKAVKPCRVLQLLLVIPYSKIELYFSC